MSGGAKRAAPRDKSASWQPERYRVTEVPHFIGGRLVQPGEIVQLPEGVKPGKKLVEVDQQGNPVVKAEPAAAETVTIVKGGKSDGGTKGGKTDQSEF